VHLVTRVHFRSRDKDGGYIIRSAVPENPMLHANIGALCMIQRESLPVEVLHCGIRIYDLFDSYDLDLGPMTFIYEFDTQCVEICRMCKYELPRQGFRKLSSGRHTELQRLRHDRNYTLWGKKTAPLYFCNNFVKTFCSEIIIGTYILQ